MVIKIYILYFYQLSILIGRGAGTVLMDYFNNLLQNVKLFIENIHHNISGNYMFLFIKITSSTSNRMGW
jgi:hypothetical protein